ncbi:MAG: hypothetical protein HYY17_10705 [Planctomycetes bacterium]|nr:hypothetical protein [Planctomycetota bacterium]
MRPRRFERGVTLIEILLALLVMVLGIVGILALFPAALQASKESVEETQAGITAESVAQALTNAVRFGTYDGTKARHRIVLTHDLKYTGTNSYVRYAFWLPKLAGEDWLHYPNGVADAPSSAPADGLTTYIGTGVAANTPYDPESLPAFNLAGDPWIWSSVKTVRDTNDPSDPYTQFGFSFSVMKINTLAYMIGTAKPGGGTWTEADLEPLVKMFEFRINVFRMITEVSGGGSGSQTATTVKKLIPHSQVTLRVSVK